MRRSISIYLAYFSQFLKARLSYKADFFAAVVASALVSLTGLVFILFLIDGETIPELQGWKREEVLFIYGYSMLPLALFSLLSPNLYEFGDRYVIQGQFDRVLLRPLNSLSQVLFESFNLESIGNCLVGIGVIIYAQGKLQIEFSLIDYLWLALSSVSGGIILLGVFITLASMSFHFEDRLGITAPFFNLMAFGRYPVTIFNRTIQFILSWVVPFAFVAFFPATHFFERDGFQVYCYSTPLVAIVCMIVANLAWKYGVSKYASTGN